MNGNAFGLYLWFIVPGFIAVVLVVAWAVSWVRYWWMVRRARIPEWERVLATSDAMGFRRDPCGPGLCRFKAAEEWVCGRCGKALYECEWNRARTLYGLPLTCTACLPFRLEGVPEGFEDVAKNRCPHNRPDWQQCPECQRAVETASASVSADKIDTTTPMGMVDPDLRHL